MNRQEDKESDPYEGYKGEKKPFKDILRHAGKGIWAPSQDGGRFRYCLLQINSVEDDHFRRYRYEPLYIAP